MLPAIRTPDAELWATGFVRAHLGRPEVYVGRALPQGSRDYAAVLQYAGGRRLDAVREVVRLSVRVWAPTDAEANSLAADVRAVLTAAPKGSRPTVPVPVDNPTPLRHFTAEVLVRGQQFTLPQ